MLLELAKVLIAILLLNLVEGQFFLYSPLISTGFLLLSLGCIFALFSILARNPKLARILPLLAFPVALGFSLLFDYLYSIPALLSDLVGLPPRPWGIPVLFEMLLFVLFWLATHVPVAFTPGTRGLARLKMLARFTSIPIFLVSLAELITEMYASLPMIWLLFVGRNPAILLVAVLTGYLALALFSPFLLARAFKTRKLVDENIRTALTTLAQKAGVKLRDILIWDTEGARYHNALVTGFVGKMRYILVSDAILEDFPANYITAVFAHELSHSKKHHFKLLALAAFGLLGITTCITLELHNLDDISLSIIVPGTALLYIILLLLPLYRTLERQADIEGVSLLDEPLFLAHALKYLGSFFPSRKRKHSFTHYGLDERAEILERCTAPSFHADLRKKIKKRILLLLVPIVLLIAGGIYSSYRHRNELKIEQWMFLSEIALEKEQVEYSAQAISEILRLRPDNSLQIYLGLHYLDMEDFEKALMVYNKTEPQASIQYLILKRELKKRKLVE